MHKTRAQVRLSSWLLLGPHRGMLKFTGTGQHSPPGQSGARQARGAQAVALVKRLHQCSGSHSFLHEGPLATLLSHSCPALFYFLPRQQARTGPTWSTRQVQHDNCSFPSVQQLLISLCLLFWLHSMEKILIHGDK